VKLLTSGNTDLLLQLRCAVVFVVVAIKAGFTNLLRVNKMQLRPSATEFISYRVENSN